MGVGMFCHACGADNEDHSRFCRSCGSALATVATVPGSLPVPADTMPAMVPTPAQLRTTRRAVKICPMCETDFPSSLAFCDRDGTALVALGAVTDEPQVASNEAHPSIPAMEPAEVLPSMAAPRAGFCEDCGSGLLPADTYCSDCGYRVDILRAPGAASTVTAAPWADENRHKIGMDAHDPILLESKAISEPTVLEAEVVAKTIPMSSAQDEQPSLSAKHESRDGGQELLEWLAPAPALPSGYQPESLASGEEVENMPKGSGTLVWAVSMLGLIAAVGGAGFVWREQLVALVGGDAEGSAAAELAAAPADIPRVAGKYTAFLMDQEIEIAFEGGPDVLAQAKGTAHYLNTVNGGRCVSRLVAVESGGIGGDPNGKVLFSQQPRDGEPACGQDIPVLIDLDKQTIAEDGLVSRLLVEWQSPETGKVLMSGDLILAEGAE